MCKGDYNEMHYCIIVWHGICLFPFRHWFVPIEHDDDMTDDDITDDDKTVDLYDDMSVDLYDYVTDDTTEY